MGKGFIAGGLMMLVSGCSKPVPAQLVSWYLEHDTERQAKVAWCADDASRGQTADCRNALEAQRQKQMGSQQTLKPIEWGAKP